MKAAATVLLAIAAIGTPSAIHQPQLDPQGKIPPRHEDLDLHGTSLYRLDSAWSTDDGQSLRLHDLSGRCQILALMFTRCTGICPLTVAAMQTFYRQLPQESARNIQVALVTIDPSDTEVLLRAYRAKLKLDKSWLLLRGSPEALRELTAALGFSYEAQGDQFAHSNLVTVLDRDGNIAHQQAGAGGSTQELQDALGRVCTRQ